MRLNEREELLLLFGTLVFYIVMQFFFLQTKFEYDHSRDLTIIKEIATRGSFSYLGSSYVINPPLIYVFYGMLSKIVGFNYFLIKFIEISIYWLSTIIFYIVVDKDKLMYFIYSYFWVFLLASAIRSYSFEALFGSVFLYLFFKKQNFIYVGIFSGLALLTKSSLVFLIIPLYIKLLSSYVKLERGKIILSKRIVEVLISMLIALLIYMPYVIYLVLNHLPLPWESSIKAASSKASWAHGSKKHIFSLFLDVCKHIILYPISLLTYCYLMIVRKRDTLSNFLIVFALFSPLFLQLIVSMTDLHHVFYIWPIIAYSCKFFNKRIKLLLFVVLTVISIYFVNLFTINASFWNSDLVKVMSSFNEGDVILSQFYNHIDVFSNGYGEYSNNFSVAQIAVYHANYILSNREIDMPCISLIKKMKSFNFLTKSNEVWYYSVNLSCIFSHFNLSVRRVKLVNANNEAMSFAICSVIFDDKYYYQVSGRDGSIYVVPNATINCISLGYKKFTKQIGNETTITINQIPNYFIHRYTNTRY